ncbi:hypothetical protein AVEN_258605-1 [Araneus ventricosus]|uniref:Uncharacterized protein n=1 Tax=Araneus ventricosus TaxID=182803 RepID=A0A4Y2SII0_ARAVE|nr:hypothetical protein AVEN_258605-1 [Araneus ventricosus]
MLTSYEKEMERLRKILPEVETDEDSDFDSGDIEPENILEENFMNHESFSEQDTESEEDRDSGNKEVNLGRIYVLDVIILCRAYLEQKGQLKM